LKKDEKKCSFFLNTNEFDPIVFYVESNFKHSYEQLNDFFPRNNQTRRPPYGVGILTGASTTSSTP
jgi:hypothetical protein